jgi:hypothetical protein
MNWLLSTVSIGRVTGSSPWTMRSRGRLKTGNRLENVRPGNPAHPPLSGLHDRSELHQTVVTDVGALIDDNSLKPSSLFARPKFFADRLSYLHAQPPGIVGGDPLLGLLHTHPFSP